MSSIQSQTSSPSLPQNPVSASRLKALTIAKTASGIVAVITSIAFITVGALCLAGPASLPLLIIGSIMMGMFLIGMLFSLVIPKVINKLLLSADDINN
ncbi:hypothetical protein [Chlamydia vaughanii]|uniref:hypothetical protein n=1 Tax=Chlamydia vaughanii TaxID=3112552 RepID=UPI0032B2DDA2